MNRRAWVIVISLSIYRLPPASATGPAAEKIIESTEEIPDADTSALAPMTENWLERRFKEPSDALRDSNAHDHELFHQPQNPDTISDPFLNTEKMRAATPLPR